jgi:hypothetical protein
VDVAVKDQWQIFDCWNVKVAMVGRILRPRSQNSGQGSAITLKISDPVTWSSLGPRAASLEDKSGDLVLLPTSWPLYYQQSLAISVHSCLMKSTYITLPRPPRTEHHAVVLDQEIYRSIKQQVKTAS